MAKRGKGRYNVIIQRSGDTEVRMYSPDGRLRQTVYWDGRGQDDATPPDGDPSSLSLTVISSSEIQLDWTAGSTNQDGHLIEYSLDNSTWVALDNVFGATVHYHATGLTTATLYYFRVKAYKDGLYSEYSNVDSDTTL